MPGRVVVQWDKDSVEDAGLIKIDLLSLRTLGAIEEAHSHIQEQHEIVPDLDHLPLNDPAVYELLQRADTVGCFQVESRAQGAWFIPTCAEGREQNRFTTRTPPWSLHWQRRWG